MLNLLLNGIQRKANMVTKEQIIDLPHQNILLTTIFLFSKASWKFPSKLVEFLLS